MRPTWDETRIEMARVIARRSLCVRDQVGAIIVDANQKVIGEGHNGPPKNFVHRSKPCIDWCERSVNALSAVSVAQGSNYDNCPALHAEANALMMSDRSLRAGGLIYVTSHPCSGCAKLIANSGLMGVYVHADPEHEYRNDPAIYKFLTELGMLVRIVR